MIWMHVKILCQKQKIKHEEIINEPLWFTTHFKNKSLFISDVYSNGETYIRNILTKNRTKTRNVLDYKNVFT